MPGGDPGQDPGPEGQWETKRGSVPIRPTPGSTSAGPHSWASPAKGSYLMVSAKYGEKYTMENIARNRDKNSHRPVTQFSVSAARVCSGGKTRPVHSQHCSGLKILHNQGGGKRAHGYCQRGRVALHPGGAGSRAMRRPRGCTELRGRPARSLAGACSGPPVAGESGRPPASVLLPSMS